MPDVYRCSVTNCKYNSHGECEAEQVEIEEKLTGGGFLPLCDTYEEEE